ncbi:hypothetical protein [Candidatus Chlorohelix sp.]|uniref:hypothetical protein n=1 Tax=Candidatus Chlorohelix sp. TaxID=3139201 RepID=UPI003070A837
MKQAVLYIEYPKNAKEGSATKGSSIINESGVDYTYIAVVNNSPAAISSIIVDAGIGYIDYARVAVINSPAARTSGIAIQAGIDYFKSFAVIINSPAATLTAAGSIVIQAGISYRGRVGGDSNINSPTTILGGIAIQAGIGYRERVVTAKINSPTAPISSIIVDAGIGYRERAVIADTNSPAVAGCLFAVSQVEIGDGQLLLELTAKSW